MCLISQAQQKDSVKTVAEPGPSQIAFPDSIFRFNVHHPIPKRAGLYSACLPGLGQLYNKQYWKVGLVYAGSAVLTGFLISNYNQYNKYRKIYIGMIDNDPSTPDTYPNRTVDDILYLRNAYRKDFEYSIISASLAYILNILDAFISAHLKSFDMSNDISYHAVPWINSQKQIGLQLSFALK
jgi:hypothetical protein